MDHPSGSIGWWCAPFTLDVTFFCFGCTSLAIHDNGRGKRERYSIIVFWDQIWPLRPICSMLLYMIVDNGSKLMGVLMWQFSLLEHVEIHSPLSVCHAYWQFTMFHYPCGGILHYGTHCSVSSLTYIKIIVSFNKRRGWDFIIIFGGQL